MIIGICGNIGAGKNAIADFLVSEYNFTRLSFANSLKEAVSAIFGWSMDMLDGVTPEARIAREEVDQWWAKRLQIPNFTPRLALQMIGTNVMRDHFNTDIWVASLERKLSNTSQNVVITDCRFPNEIQAIKSVNGQLWKVTRGIQPAWVTLAELANFGDETAATELSKFNIHPSETAWIGSKFDVTIENDGTLNQLQETVKQVFNTAQIQK